MRGQRDEAARRVGPRTHVVRYAQDAYEDRVDKHGNAERVEGTEVGFQSYVDDEHGSHDAGYVRVIVPADVVARLKGDHDKIVEHALAQVRDGIKAGLAQAQRVPVLGRTVEV